MSRPSKLLFVIAAILAALIAIVLSRYVENEREELQARLSEDRMHLLTQAVSRVENHFNVIREDLRLAAQLLREARSDEEQRRMLAALLFVVRPYRAGAVFNAKGEVLWEIADPRSGGDGLSTAPFRAAMREAVLRVQKRPPGEVANTGALPSEAPGTWFRAYAVTLPGANNGDNGPAALVLLVQGEIIFLREVSPVTGAGVTRLLLLGDRGSHPVTDDDLERLSIQHEKGQVLPPSIAGLFFRMREGRLGTQYIPGEEAQKVGLGSEPIISAFSPIRLPDGGHWSFAALTSLPSLRHQEVALRLRLFLVSGGAMALVAIGFSFFVLSARRAEYLRERLQQTEQIAHLHEKTDKILNHVPVGVVVVDAENRVTGVNRLIRERVPAAPVQGSLSACFPGMGAEVDERLGSLIAEARVAGKVRSLHGERLQLFDKEGHYSVHAIPLRPSQPDAEMLLVIEDLSELQTLTAQLLRSEKLATVGVLAAGIAHEIGTPLQVVRGRAEFLVTKLGSEHPLSESARIIVEQIDHVSRIVRQLLDFARTKQAVVRPTDLPQVLRGVADLLRMEAERRGVHLVTEFPTELPPLAAEADQLQQVMVNLIINSYDACQRGGTVRIAAEVVEGEAGEGGAQLVKIVVTDDGCGIAPENLVQVFDPFFTTKKRGQGTGLGLTIAAQIVRNHGGHIEIKSELNKGTDVIIEWPGVGALKMGGAEVARG